jgi:hypothetical protein
VTCVLIKPSQNYVSQLHMRLHDEKLYTGVLVRKIQHVYNQKQHIREEWVSLSLYTKNERKSRLTNDLIQLQTIPEFNTVLNT